MEERLNQLLADVKARQGSFLRNYNILNRDLALYRAGAVPERSISQLRAHTVLELARELPIDLYGDWQLAGEHLIDVRYLTWCYYWGSLTDGFTREEKEKALAELQPEMELEALQKRLRELQATGAATSAGEVTPGANRGRCGWMESEMDGVFMAGGWVENHSIRDYAKLLRVGYGGLKQELEQELATFAPYSVEYAKRENFLRAGMAMCEAGIALGKRYARLARERSAQLADPAQRKHLERMAANCEQVPERGARTFAEAVQALWFGHLITCAEDSINANSLGRLDQILDPYYQADLAAGRITPEEAQVWLTELAIKLYLTYDVQAITLAGEDPQGNCAVNAVSYLMLEATRDFQELRDLSVRVSEKTPEKFWRACASLVLRGGGIPFFFNDASFIPALHDRGIALEDARNYSPIGCIELTIPGKANPHAVSGWFNLLKVLELTLFNGVNPRNGNPVGRAQGGLAEFANFDAFLQAFLREVEFFAGKMVYTCRRGEINQREFGPLPGWSLLTDDCIKRGHDITDGGALYNYHSICLMGVPDCADALVAIRQLVFEEHAVAPEELLQALRDDFVGHEPLRRKLLNGAAKYGNGDKAADDIAGLLCNHFIDLMDAWSEPGNRLHVHLFTFLLNIDFGKKVGAMPDGRHAGEPLAYSLSAHQGRDLAGVTAFLHSLSKMPHHRAGGASAAIIDLHPSIFTGSDPEELMVQLLKSAIAMGVGQMQWNVMSAEQLERAQREPEKYGNIPVRVAGYSQLFNLIAPELQDHIIARYKHQSL